MSLVLFATATLAMSAATAGCGAASGNNQPQMPGSEAPLEVTEVADDEFARAVHRILRQGRPSPERLSLLAGVVRRQLGHASERFELGHDARGESSVIGALYLMRLGESRREMIDQEGIKALAGAIDRVSARGDEGTAQALMEMVLAAVPEGSDQRREVEEHLAALARWQAETRTGSAIERLGAAERAAVQRSLIDPTQPALDEATRAISLWIDKAIEHNIAFRQTGKRPSREEAVEASRALESGAATLIGIYLRHGEAFAALEAVEQTAARRVIRPGFYSRLQHAAEDNTPRAWRELFVAYAEESEASGGEIGIDVAVLRAGLWGIGLEAYRRDPTDFDVARVLARSLVSLGMSEVSPLVLADALGESPPPDRLSSALGLTMAALREEAAHEDTAAARRTMESASAILALADSPAMRGQIQPTAAQIRFLMASIELRAGNLAAARPLLERAVEEDPSAAGYTMLAVLERQAQNAEAALAHVDRANAPPFQRLALLDVADANLLAFEIHRENGAKDEAKRALDSALSSVLAARERGVPVGAKARAERLLGRILDNYGDPRGASRAMDRALEIAAQDRPTLSITMLEAIGHALVQGDVELARDALRRGLDADVDEDDLVYGGLWVLLLERQAGVTPDGTAARALESRNRQSWTGKLASWARGELSDEALHQSAQNESQRVEAAFYAAMSKKIAGDPAAKDALRDVSRSNIIDLVEVHLAREMVAPELVPELPSNVKLP
jgi:cellulose synthase operon protein C